MKKNILIIFVLFTTILMAACAPAATSPSSVSDTSPAQTTAAATQESTAPAAETTASAVETAALSTAASTEGLVPFEFENFGIRLSIPAEMTQSQDAENENGLTFVAASEDFSINLFLLVRENSENDTLADYRQTSPLWDYINGEPAVDSVVTIGNVEFWKLVDHDDTPGEEIRQIIYTAFSNGFAYEVTLTLTKEFYDANTTLLEELEKTIIVTPLS